MGLPDKKRPLEPKTFRLPYETVKVLKLFGKIKGKDMNEWVRKTLSDAVAREMADETVARKIQELDLSQNVAEI